MKMNFRTFLNLLISVLILASCKKDKDLSQPVPQKPGPPTAFSFQLNFDPIAGETEATLRNHSVIVSVVNSNDETVLDKRKLALSFDGKFKTPEVKLAAGEYRVVSCWIVNENNQARFAAPLLNSKHAIKVSKPLPVNFILPAPVVLQVPVDIAKIETGDTPVDFGYAAGSFVTLPGDGEEEPATVLVRLRLAIRIGEVNYDNLEAGVAYTYWDENQNPRTSYVSIRPEDNSITLVRKATRHQFRINKWGQTYELSISKDEVREGETYNMGGVKPARMLKNELEYRLVNGVYVADSKKNFVYSAPGRLSGIEYFSRRPDGAPYIAMKDEFRFTGSRVTSIARLDERSQLTGTTEISYDGFGRISNLVFKSSTTTATASVSYQFTPATGVSEVTTKHQDGLQYFQRFISGNLVSDNSLAANGNTETGEYTYDKHVNPYIHMGWPEVYPAKNSRNNLNGQNKTFYGLYPSAVAYKFEYKYDAEGYPVELIRHYKSYLTNTPLHTTKTVFTY
jgi:hypothetical protein